MWTPESVSTSNYTPESIATGPIYSLRSGMLYDESGRTYDAEEQVPPKTLYNGLKPSEYAIVGQITNTNWTS